METTFVREVLAQYKPTEKAQFKISSPKDVADFVRSILPDNSREHFVALYLSGSHHVSAYAVISTGTVNASLVHPREVFQRAILAGAVSLVVSHNHPSGSLDPSPEDEKVTSKLTKAGDLLGIKLLDHVIVTDSEHYSFKENVGIF